VDADDELKDIKLGFLSRGQYVMGSPRVHVTKPAKQYKEKKSAYEKACEQYGVAPSWTVKGQERTKWS
jgi:hypothetical protein